MSLRLWTRLVSVAVLTLVATAPARAIEVDKYLPADSETLVVINVKQVVGSQLIKKHALKQIQDAIKDQESTAKILEALGFDPLKDLDRILMAAPAGGEQDKALVVAYGKYDVEKFKTEAEKYAKDNKDALEVITAKDGEGGEVTLYKVTLPNQQGGQDVPMYVHLANKTTMLASPSKDQVMTAIKVKGDKKPTFKNKAFAEMVEKLDGQQSLGLVLPGSVLTQGPLADLPVKDQLATITIVSGGITVTDGLKMEFTLACKEADNAKDLKKTIDDYVTQGQLALAVLAGGQKELAPVLELLKSMKTTSKDKNVTIKAELSADTINKAIQQDQ